MNENNANPLAKHFRQPAIYIKLPSGGAWNNEETLQNTENGELPVYPMTALDEIAYRTADALFNGSAAVSYTHLTLPTNREV